MRERVDIVELRLAHLRATSAAEKGWHHVAVQNYLLCLEAVEAAGDARAVNFFASRLARCYRAMGLEDKASRYQSIA